MPTPFKYFAFISYSRKDSKVAAWLQKRLEWFRFPVKLVPEERRPLHARYVRPIYRDKTNLEVTHEHYWTNIRRALEESRYLIVLCSPSSARSEPVNMEVAHFLASHGGEASLVVPVIAGGSVTSAVEDAALCPALSALGDTLTSRNLPTMVPDADTLERDAWEQGFVALISYLLRLERSAIGDHIQRETRRQTRVLRRWLAAVVILTLCSIAGGVYSLVKKREADRQTLEVTRQRQEVQNQREKQEELLWTASRGAHEDAIRLFRAGDRNQGLAKLLRAVELQPENIAALAASEAYSSGLSAHGWQTRQVWTLKDLPRLNPRFSQDGKAILVPTEEQELLVVDPASGKPIRTIKTLATLAAFAISPDSKWLAVACENKEVLLIDMQTGKEVPGAKWNTLANSIEFSPDGKHLAIGSAEDDTILIDDPLGERVLRVNLEGTPIHKVQFSADSSMVASLADQKFWIRATKPSGVVWAFDIGTKVCALQFTPDGKFAIVAAGYPGNQGLALVIDTQTGREVARKQCGFGLSALALSPDGEKIAGLEMMSVWLADRRSLKEIGKATFNEAGFSDTLQFSPDGCFLVAGRGHALKIIEAEGVAVRDTIILSDDIRSAEFSADGRWLAATASDHSLHIAQPTACSFVDEWQCLYDVDSLAFSEDSSWLAIGASGGQIKVVDPAKAKEIANFVFDQLDGATWAVAFGNTRNQLAVRADSVALMLDVPNSKTIFQTHVGSSYGGDLIFNPEGSMLATTGAAGHLQVLEAAEGRVIADIPFSERVLAMGFSPDGKWLAAASDDHTLKIVEPRSGHEILKRTYPEEIETLAISGDGQLIALAGRPGKDLNTSSVRIIHAGTGDELAHVDFDSSVWSVDFSADSRLVVAGSSDRTLRVFDARSGDELTRVDYASSELLTNYVSHVQFSKDGRWIVAVVDGSARIVEASTGNQVARLDIGDGVEVAALSPDSRWLALGSKDGLVRVYDLSWLPPDTERPDTSWLNRLRTIAGQNFDKDGRLEFVSVETPLDEKLAATPSNRWQEAIRNWGRNGRISLTTSPWTTDQVHIAIGRWLMQTRNDTFTIRDCANSAPWHPLEPVSLARLKLSSDDETDTTTNSTRLIRSRFLAGLTLKRLRNADEKLYSSDILVEYAAWAAKIMHEELKLDAEAREAISIALEFSTPEKRKELLELKAKIEHATG